MKVKEFANNLPKYIQDLKREKEKHKKMYEMKCAEYIELQKQVNDFKKKYIDEVNASLSDNSAPKCLCGKTLKKLKGKHKFAVQFADAPHLTSVTNTNSQFNEKLDTETQIKEELQKDYALSELKEGER